jgi:hypothetical protein
MTHCTRFFGLILALSVMVQGYAQPSAQQSATAVSPIVFGAEKGFPGLMGLGTLNATGVFKNFQTFAGYSNVYKPLFVWDLAEWRWSPEFTLENGEMVQSDAAADHIARLVTPYEGDWTMEVQVKKTSVRGALQIQIGGKDNNNYYRLVIGGDNSAGCGLEKVENGTSTALTKTYPVALAQNSWHSVRVETKGDEIRVLMDGTVVFAYVKNARI